MNLSTQARFGKIILVSFLVVIIIPIFPIKLGSPQALTVNTKYVREDSPTFHKFLEGIKSNNGVLIIGTSETANSLHGNNYWHMLNKDRKVKPRFSVLAGAGRSSYVWFPIILANQHRFKDLQVLYYINPTYWRNDLNYFNNAYYERYNSSTLIQKIAPEAKRFKLWSFVSPYALQHLGSGGWMAELKNKLKDYGGLSFYSYDVNEYINSRFIREKNVNYSSPSPSDLNLWKKGLNLEYNTSDEYALVNGPKGILPVDIASSFQYDALAAFIKLSKQVKIKLLILIGPYNGILARRSSPAVISDYDKLLINIKEILVSSNTPFIDASDLSYEGGTFRDAQHLSAYGAWKIEQKIVDYYSSL